jgi:hypothetical protein
MHVTKHPNRPVRRPSLYRCPRPTSQLVFQALNDRMLHKDLERGKSSIGAHQSCSQDSEPCVD